SGQLVNSHIETVNADGSVRALFRTCRRLQRCRDGSPTWSPGGSMLAFASLTRLGTAAANGSSVDRLRRRTLHDGEPTWAPDGARLAFTGQAGTTAPMNVFILGCTGCALRQLTHIGATEPAWSSTDLVAFPRNG